LDIFSIAYKIQITKPPKEPTHTKDKLIFCKSQAFQQ